MHEVLCHLQVVRLSLGPRVHALLVPQRQQPYINRPNVGQCSEDGTYEVCDW